MQPSISCSAEPKSIITSPPTHAKEATSAGWSEVMPLVLCSHDENFAWFNRPDDGTTAEEWYVPGAAA
jgi:phenylalanyl-tRNA synthetase beta chain